LQTGRHGAAEKAGAAGEYLRGSGSHGGLSSVGSLDDRTR
jgi:hypothetical protein